ncbi:NAD(P)-dependent oxidoreductase [Paenibacillus sp. GD4]|uniref:NAD(P)-dependent oxidoreductase n=1 Tax=Paenibacillus sp. GD4 TaxID=3068890 RepID=UPI0027963D25|nr:NAD(P)-dependent oxidoreductase [Paenibacillus sp. GD4]MDQ1910293.1 NAD(P)-dependent oxidoreductase [Paenibacillus sp. GD4]
MTKVGFIGLGNMGLPMATNLTKAGFEVYGLNRSPGAEQRFAEAGGRTGLSLQALSQEMEVLTTCLPLPQDVEQVYLGENGIVPNGRPGLILIDFSTVSPDLNKKIAAAAQAKGMEFLDAPVSGGTAGAVSATLSIMVGGKAEVFESVKPLLEALGKNIYLVGDVGSGTVVKLINQLMVGIHTQAASEALVLGQQLGANLDTLVQILSNSFAQSRILDRHYNSFIAKDQFEAGFALKLLHKDVALVQQVAGELKLELPMGAKALQLLSDVKMTELAEKDMSAMYLFQQTKVNGGNNQ